MTILNNQHTPTTTICEQVPGCSPAEGADLTELLLSDEVDFFAIQDTESLYGPRWYLFTNGQDIRNYRNWREEDYAWHEDPQLNTPEDLHAIRQLHTFRAVLKQKAEGIHPLYDFQKTKREAALYRILAVEEVFKDLDEVEARPHWIGYMRDAYAMLDEANAMIEELAEAAEYNRRTDPCFAGIDVSDE